MKTMKIGLATITIRGGWPVSPNYEHYEYDAHHSSPIVEDYTLETRYEQKYLDYDGDVATRHWSTFEDKEREVGTNRWTTREKGISVSYRIRYDDGTTSDPVAGRSGMSMTSRIQAVSISHPLLRGRRTWWTFGTQTINPSGAWTRLMTMGARRAFARHVAQERREMLEAVPVRARCLEPQAIWDDGRHVVDGLWNAAQSKVATTGGSYAIPAARGLRDGEVVSMLVRHAPKRDVIDAWMTAGRVARPWRRKVIVADVGRAYLPSIVLVGMAAALFGIGYATRSDLMAYGAIGLVVVAFISMRGTDERRSSAMSRATRPSAMVERGVEEMRSRTWRRARVTHERRLGLTPGMTG